MTTSTDLEGGRLLTQLNRHVFMVMLHVSWPKMTYQIADAIVEIKTGDDKTEVEEKFRTHPQWQLMPEEWRKKLVNLEGRARTMLSAASINFATRGVSILPVTRASDVFRSLRALRREMHTYRDQFVKEYGDILRDLRVELGNELYDEAKKKLPSEESVRDKFSIVWAIMPTGGRGNVEEADIDAVEQAINHLIAEIPGPIPYTVDAAQAALQKMREGLGTTTVTDDEAEDLIREAREQMGKFTKDMLNDMAREPRQMLTDAADNLMEALRDPSRTIRNGTIEQVRRAFEMVEGFSFLASPQLLAQIRSCRERIDNVTPKMLNSDAEIGAKLAAGLQGVREEAADAQASTEAVRRFRGVKIRKRKKEAVPT